MKKILIFNVNWLGDVIFSTPVFKAVKKAYPDAQVTCLGVPRIQAVLESSPCVDDIIVYDEKGKDYNPIAKIKLIFKLRREKFDVVFLLHRSFTRALLVFLAGIPVRVGYDAKGRGSLLTHIVEPPDENVHRSEHYTKVVESYGVPVDDKVCELNVDDTSDRAVNEKLLADNISQDDFVVVVNPGGNWDLKCWPKENFALLAKRLVKEFAAKVILSGAESDVPLTRDIAKQSQIQAVIMAGKTNLKELIALMKRASLVISADSGPLHVADSVGTNTIGLFGPTNTLVTGPRGKGKSITISKDVGCNRKPCYYLECPDNTCMQSITVNDVIQKVRQIRS